MGYLGLSAARRSEQNRLWVGMAKETAHQLGTPISAIVAWIEHLKSMTEGNQDQTEVLNELGNDVKKLERVADRFSKIGSVPVLVPHNIYLLLENIRAYMSRRAPGRLYLLSLNSRVKILWWSMSMHLCLIGYWKI